MKIHVERKDIRPGSRLVVTPWPQRDKKTKKVIRTEYWVEEYNGGVASFIVAEFPTEKEARAWVAGVRP